MKTFMVFAAVGLLTAMVWVLFFKFDLPNQEISSFTPIEQSVIVEEQVLTDDVDGTAEEATVEETIEETVEEESQPDNRATSPGETIPNGNYLYYKQGQFIVKTKMVDVVPASQELASQVKTDIPEANRYKIWMVKFEQSLHNGLQVYGSSTGLNMFNVSNVESDNEAYLLNTVGDYAGCPAISIFGKDFSEDYETYVQCFIVASNSEPVLLFTGQSGGEYALNPVVFE
jgi:hypothetical protein